MFLGHHANLEGNRGFSGFVARMSYLRLHGCLGMNADAGSIAFNFVLPRCRFLLCADSMVYCNLRREIMRWFVRVGSHVPN